MDLKIQKAFEIEKTGDFRKALDEYIKIENDIYSLEDRVFLERSISACLFYIKEYEKAETYFKKILSDYKIDDAVKKEIQNCMILCKLYGGKEEQAEKELLKTLETEDLGDEETCWTYWYLGQCKYLMKDFSKMKNYYSKNLALAKKVNHEKLSFFTAHYIVSEILCGCYDEAEESLQSAKSIKDESYGLLKIAESVNNKIKGKENWQQLFDEGIEESRSLNYIENIELGEFLGEYQNNDQRQIKPKTNRKY